MTHPNPESAARIINAAGGKIVGRTRLQKVSYLLEEIGCGEGFAFSYHHYGPYSEQLSMAVNDAVALELVSESVQQATWGGNYSIYMATCETPKKTNKRQVQQISFACAAAKHDPVALELLSTAVYIAKHFKGTRIWQTVRELKPSKSSEKNIKAAFAAYCSLNEFDVPKKLPSIPKP